MYDTFIVVFMSGSSLIYVHTYYHTSYYIFRTHDKIYLTRIKVQLCLVTSETLVGTRKLLIILGL